MALDGGVLARIDRRLLKELSNEPGTQLVKLPVSPAVWSTWRRYCEIVGLTMGAALASLLRRELESVVEPDLAPDATLLEQRSRELDERESRLAEHERRLAEQEARLTAWEERLSSVEQRQRPAVVSTGRKVGRNEPCPCGSGRKYKVCHGSK